MIKKVVTFILISFLSFSINLFIPLNSSAQVREYTLENGLKIILAEDHKAPVATFQIWYKVGSRNETTGKTGLSHFLEHMMFKGTQKYGSKMFSRIIQKNGGIDNAYTTKDYTVYFQELSSDRIHLSIELEADRMQNLLLDPEEVKSERDVIKEERRLRYEDNPQRALFEEVTAAAFKAHPYNNPVIGWMSDIASLERENLYGYYKRYYSPDNSFIVIAGDIDPDKLITKTKKYFSSIPTTYSKSTIQSPRLREPQQRGERRIYLKKQAKLPFIIIAYHVPSIPHKDSYALDILTTVLSGKSGRLYQNIIKDKKIAINVFSSYSGMYLDPYLFYFGGTVPPDKDIDLLEQAIYEEIEKIKTAPPSEREIQKAINQIVAYFIMGQDSVRFQAELIGEFEMLGDWKLKDHYITNIKKITPEDVQSIVQKYFINDNRTVGILIPQK